jgi:hypothetical protein
MELITISIRLNALPGGRDIRHNALVAAIASTAEVLPSIGGRYGVFSFSGLEGDVVRPHPLPLLVRNLPKWGGTYYIVVRQAGIDDILFLKEMNYLNWLRDARCRHVANIRTLDANRGWGPRDGQGRTFQIRGGRDHGHDTADDGRDPPGDDAARNLPLGHKDGTPGDSDDGRVHFATRLGNLRTPEMFMARCREILRHSRLTVLAHGC